MLWTEGRKDIPYLVGPISWGPIILSYDWRRFYSCICKWCWLNGRDYIKWNYSGGHNNLRRFDVLPPFSP